MRVGLGMTFGVGVLFVNRLFLGKETILFLNVIEIGIGLYGL